MELDSFDMTHHVTPPITTVPDEISNNPWMDVDLTHTRTVTPIINVSPSQPKFQPDLNYKAENASSQNFDTSNIAPKAENYNVITPASSNTSRNSVDDSRHAPAYNKNRRTQTYDARILVSDIPGTLPSEKLNYLKNWFLGIDALKHIYIDEICQMDYYILQFNNILTMKKLVRNFNDNSDASSRMSPIVYIKPKSSSTHQNPHTGYRQSFKIIDLDGSPEQKQAALDSLSALTDHDAVQVLSEQPSNNELHVWIKNVRYARMIDNKCSIIAGNTVVRIGPVHYSRRNFKTRNAYVGRSTQAASLSDAHLLTNLESIGVVDVYRRTENDITSVFLVFDTAINYKNSTTKSVWIRDINLGIVPHTQLIDRPQRS